MTNIFIVNFIIQTIVNGQLSLVVMEDNKTIFLGMAGSCGKIKFPPRFIIKESNDINLHFCPLFVKYLPI